MFLTDDDDDDDDDDGMGSKVRRVVRSLPG
jgi:hypothetical protein